MWRKNEGGEEGHPVESQVGVHRTVNINCELGKVVHTVTGADSHRSMLKKVSLENLHKISGRFAAVARTVKKAIMIFFLTGSIPSPAS
jgi:hypothetical protein